MVIVPDLNLFEPAADASGVELPPHFAEVLMEVRAAISRCTDAGIPNDTVLAVLMTKLIPRLVSAYGPAGVASVLGQIAGEIARRSAVMEPANS
jgi:hypothetical protein